MTQDQKIDILWQERAITKVILRFGRALDIGDWPAYRSCMSNPVLIDFERLTGQPPVVVDADLWTELARLFQTPLRRHHTYSNISIEIDGDGAEALVYMTARHWRANDLGTAGNYQYGWYNFSLRHRDSDWRMTRVKHDFQWVDGNQGVVQMDDPAFVAVIGKVYSRENLDAAKTYSV